MADFRKCVFAFAALALLLGAAGTANAQTFQCVANAAVPALARAEGITELMGDVTISCTGGTDALASAVPGGPLSSTSGITLPTMNLRVFLSAAVTSRILNTTSGGLEALLMINDPDPSRAPFPGFVGCTSADAVPTYLNDGRICNVYQGRLVPGNPNAIDFLSVPVLPPGTTGQTTYRITNVRANASAVAPGASGSPGQVLELVSATPVTSGVGAGGAVVSPTFPIAAPQQIVAIVQNGLNFSLLAADATNALSSAGFGFSQCVSRTSASSAGFAVLRYEEGFPSAFKTRTVRRNPAVDPDFNSPLEVVEQNVPGFLYRSESGYYNPNFGTTANPGTSGLQTAGLADFSTRVRAVFTNIPTGVRLFVTTRELAPNGGNTARLVGSEVGAFFPVTALSTNYGGISGTPTTREVGEVQIVNNAGTAVWEVMTENPSISGQLHFGVYATYTADTANNSPAAPSVGSVSGSFAPVTGPTTASATAPIPRFVDLGTARNLFNLRVCVTNLLFPFVTNSAGFDTGLAISNTSQDPFATAAQAGTCTLNWYGSGAPAASATPSVAAGSTWVNTVMNLAPNFQGYMIAQCRFQYAHGFAFISDIGARNLAMGYLALIIPDATSRGANPFPTAGSGSGEQLGY